MTETKARPDRLYDYLNSLRLLRYRIETLEQRGAYLRKRAEGCSSFRALRGGGRDYTLQERHLMELLENNEMLKAVVDEINFRTTEAEQLLAKLTDEKLRFVLRDRFFLGMSWEDMEETHFFCSRYLRMLSRKGIQKLEGEYRKLLLQEEGRALP